MTSYVLHPDRGGVGTGTVPKHGVVVHDSEGGQTSTQLLIDMTLPGDRPSPSKPPPAMYGAGYNAITTEDPAGAYAMVADGTRSPYAAPPLNGLWWHICIPGKAAQTREQWLEDDVQRGHIKGVAKFIVDRWHADGQSWPLVMQMAPAMTAAGEKGCRGWTSHYQVSLAFHETDHYDPGPNFPFDVLQQDIDELVNPTPTPPPPEDEAMDLITIDKDAAVFLRDGLTCTWVKNEETEDALVADGIAPAKARPVDPLVYGALELRGPQPNYTGTDPVAFPHQTKGGDFAKWTQ